MSSMALRLIHSRLSLSRLYAVGGSKNGRFLSTESDKVDDPFNVEEAETVHVPPPPSEKLLVLGGNGFVGSHICREALNRGLTVASLSRSGRSSLHDSWAKNVTWHQGNLLSSDSWKEALNGVTSVISCVGGFGSNSYMYKINGTANINAIRAAAEKGVKRFIYISAADFGLANYLLQGYYEGKRAAETELLTKFPYGGGDFEAWLHLRDSQCWKCEVTSRCCWLSTGNGSPTCKTTEPASTCWPTVHSSH
ncbi:NAD(P)-binding Rossmann-fold superfamily protein isoform 2 [Theobroma cacao]|uniref:NAD(P)-binding Rossmann-fold superfamily protein isoform 2 n=1 Tax=Theobroma cacao TaxID=3641 RepID=A0A061GQ73_THECC|nr:NAD(P)-binding Rossmann-fold superfamily protein isoform 2 [Theobroma cacao]